MRKYTEKNTDDQAHRMKIPEIPIHLKPKAIVIGTSAGGVEALTKLFKALRPGFSIPILVVQHISPSSDSYLVQHLNRISSVTVKEALDKTVIEPFHAYLAPPNYHLLIEEDFTIALTVDEKVSYARPSIDVLFETAARAFNRNLLGIILTGANSDGAYGASMLRKMGGYLIVQDPSTAHIATMPETAIQQAGADFITNLEGISQFLNRLP